LLVAQGNLTGIVYAEIPDRQLRERLGVKHSIQAVNQGIDENFSQGFLLEAATFAICAGSEDKKEGSSAFLAKRPPKSLGR